MDLITDVRDIARIAYGFKASKALLVAKIGRAHV